MGASQLLTFNGAVASDPAIARWFASMPDDLRPIAQTWFARMRHRGADVRELMHDGYATVCVGGAPFAYVGVFTRHVNVGFFHGAHLPDPSALLQGTGKNMRHVKLAPGRSVDAPQLDALIDAAYRDIVASLQMGGQGP